jgi:hypothetical protein
VYADVTLTRHDNQGRLKPMFIQFVLEQIWAVYNGIKTIKKHKCSFSWCSSRSGTVYIVLFVCVCVCACVCVLHICKCIHTYNAYTHTHTQHTHAHTQPSSCSQRRSTLKPFNFVFQQTHEKKHPAVLLQPDAERALKIVTALDLGVSERELKNTNREEALRCVMARWLPLADALLEMIVEQLPSPQTAQSERIKRLLPEAAAAPAAATAAAHAEGCGSGSAERVLAGEESMRRCDAGAVEVMAFVSKMFAADPLPRDTQRRFIGFTRVFAGTLRVGDTIMVLGPRHEPPAGRADSAGGEEGGGGGEVASADGMRHASR